MGRLGVLLLGLVVVLVGCAANGSPAGQAIIARPALSIPASHSLISSTGHYRALYSFTGGADGSSPYSELIVDSSGNLYGTTAYGGSSNNGVVFRLDASGAETIIHTFNGGDGSQPAGRLIRDTSGNFYGVALDGAAFGYGGVFELDPSGNETFLHSFNFTDGAYPNKIVRDSAGNLFGTTGSGGLYNCGVFFKIDPSFNESAIHDFGGVGDGCEPIASLLAASSGTFYGTTTSGGTSGEGIVYKIDTSGNELVLHNFPSNSVDGFYPEGELVRDRSGALYGTTYYGGSNRDGVVYKIDASGNESVIVTFNVANGSKPVGGLYLNSGVLFGTTMFGGSVGIGGHGIAFKIKDGTTEVVLHNFGPPGGAYPEATLVKAANGNLYGTTSGGGEHKKGVVFEITP